jgi:hypothetical protein
VLGGSTQYVEPSAVLNRTPRSIEAALPLGHPAPQRADRQSEVLGHFSDRLAAGAAQLDHLGFVGIGERPPRPFPFLLHGLHFGHSFGALQPDRGCPSKWANARRSGAEARLRPPTDYDMGRDGRSDQCQSSVKMQARF